MRPLLYGGLLLLAACAPPTPFPVTPVATRITPEAATTQEGVATVAPIRYGVLPNAADYAPLADLGRYRTTLEVIDGETDTSQYDVLTGFGIYDGWTVAPVRFNISLILNTQRPPLDVNAIADVVRHAVQPDAVIETIAIPGAEVLFTDPWDSNRSKAVLANVGYPNGFTIYATASALPGTDAIINAFAATNITVRTVQNFSASPHLQMVGWHSDEQRSAWEAEFGSTNVIDLYTLPISYTTNGDFVTTFTDDGWVIAARREVP